MDAFLGKKYKLDSSENFDEYMKALDVGMITRKVANTASSSICLTKAGDTYTLKIESTFKNQTIVFKLGEEIEEETMDGRKVKTVFTANGNVLTQLQKGGKETTIVRDYSDSQVKAVYTVGSVVCTRVFKAV